MQTLHETGVFKVCSTCWMHKHWAHPSLGACTKYPCHKQILVWPQCVHMSISGLFDANKEQQRLQKQQAKLEKDLQGLRGRLKNPKFVQNAKSEVVKEAQQAAAEGEQKLAQIQQKMQQIAHLL